MLTFEKVLEEFKDYLAEEDVVEVVVTKHGYTVMSWDEPSKTWYGVEHCETSEDLQEILNQTQSSYKAFKG